jgi:hypothetical protein
MKEFLRLRSSVALLLLSTGLFAQQPPFESQISGYARINFGELANKELQNPQAIPSPRYVEFRPELPNGLIKNRTVTGNPNVTEINLPSTNLPQQALLSSPAPIKSFTGIKDNNTVIPPDVMGVAGPNHLMETLNSFYRIYSKTGSVILTLTTSAFWAPLGSFVSDPHLTFDSSTSHWIHCCIGQLSNGHYAIFIAVTVTSDPTGNWFEYSIDTGPTSTVPDYPQLGYNKKWVVITTNDFVNNLFNSVRIIVLNKSKLVTGTLGTVKTFFDNGIFGLSPAETLDPGQGTEYLLADYNGNSGKNGFVRISTITGTVGSPVYTAGSPFGVNQPWSETTVNEPQNGTKKFIDGGDTRMSRPIVRGGSLWATQTVFLPANHPSRSAAQWWQINPATNAVVQFGRLDDGTGTFDFAYPSIAVNTSNGVLIGCSLFGSSIFASTAYAYRNSSDALNTLRTFFEYKAGGNTYYKTFGGSRNRWGDFSSACIDYSDGSFWTLQEFATATANTWGTWWANIGAAAFAFGNPNASVATDLTNTKALFISPNPAKAMATLRWQSSIPGIALLSVINSQGDLIHTQKVPVIAGYNQQLIPVQDLTGGTYIITLSINNEIQQTKLVIEK